MDISYYLVKLLRMHDCVIVPDLGGFIANFRSAEMDLATNNFKPPVKEIIFTGKLSKNDGLLVNFISETEGVGYLEARLMISEFVDETWSKLENGEKISFQNIGTLQFDRNEKLIFEPEFHENFLLDAYGMEGFRFPQIEHRELISTKRVFVDKEAVRPVFGSRKVKALVLFGIPVLLALIFIPVSKYSRKGDTGSNLQVSSTASIPSNDSAKPSNTIKYDQTPATRDTIRKEVAINNQTGFKQVNSESHTVQPDGRFRIIGGCFKLRENADKFIEKLRGSGFRSEIKVQPGGMFVVVVQSYSDKSEATLALKILREAEPETGYWLSVN